MKTNKEKKGLGLDHLFPLSWTPYVPEESFKCVARALYDNIAESPDELAFRRGDLLTVLEQNTSGIEGWWLCALRGRQGICPGNRLRLVAGVFEPQQHDLSTLQRQGKRRSWHVQPNKVSVTSQWCSCGPRAPGPGARSVVRSRSDDHRWLAGDKTTVCRRKPTHRHVGSCVLGEQ
ncbi:Breast cancer anti-estrogen resistance [Homalodisca vitripennis]|nr:Breast cancer anti-estrogen resistance [Homalodisca vitripennis]